MIVNYLRVAADNSLLSCPASTSASAKRADTSSLRDGLAQLGADVRVRASASLSRVS